MSVNAHHDLNRKRLSHMKIPKKIEKPKFPESSATGNKVTLALKNEPATSFTEIKNIEIKDKIVKPDDIEKQKTIKTNDSACDVNIKTVVHKDEDLRVRMPLNEEANSTRMVKKENEETSSYPVEIEKSNPPRKKIKTEDAENCNPDYRTDSPVLFGSEDQDLRHPSLSDINSKDWTQYKAAHPDEYSPSPGRPDRSEGRFRYRKQRFSDSRPYHLYEYDRFSSSRHLRGRYGSRRNARRMYFPRGMRGRWFHNSHVSSVMLNSHAFLQQAEEKYRTGRISEAEYLDLCRDLQKVAENSEHDVFKYYMPRKQNVEQYARVPEVHNPRPEYNYPNQYPFESAKVQRSSDSRPSEKSFFLDGNERLIHFIDDKAIVCLDEDEPRELTFLDEKRQVYIDGLAEPLTLGFDGKSVEFEIDGRRHIVRLGIPGREIYINNQPYEAQYGGPPVVVMLEDGCLYQIRLSGPPPQVIVGDKPQYELLDKYQGKTKNVTFPLPVDGAPEELNIQSQSPISSSSSVQDVDMRVKPQNVHQPIDNVMNEDDPFYSDNMKDVDWRHLPLPIPPPPMLPPLESENNPSGVFSKNVSNTFEIWTKDSDDRGAFCEDRNNQHGNSESKEPLPYEWNKTEQKQYAPVHTEGSNLSAPDNLRNRYHKSDNTSWQSINYTKIDNLSHHQDISRYEPPVGASQQFKDNIEQYKPVQNQQYERVQNQQYEPVQNQQYKPVQNQQYNPVQSHSYLSYSMRPSQSQTTEAVDEASGPRPWAINADGSRHAATHLFNQPQTSTGHKTLLPPPPFPPLYPFVAPTTPHMYTAPQKEDGLLKDPVKLENEPTPDYSLAPGPDNRSAVPPPFELKVDVESLLQKLIATGIINTKPTESSEADGESFEISAPEVSEEKENESVTEIPEIELTAESLRVHRPSVISALHKGLQCATCGMRFKDMQGDQYSHHLDWHFRMNRREKDGAKKAVSRRWNYEIEDWIQFEEFEDFEERVPSYFELQAEEPVPEEPKAPAVVSVAATSDDQDNCPVCNERFQLFWVEEEEEWHYRNAIRRDNIAYHPACYEDFKKAAEAEEAEKALKSAQNASDDLCDVLEEVSDVLNSILDDLCEKVDIERNVRDKTDSMETGDEVPSNECHSEEEILEGKPGEEEIIGLISESDMETDSDLPLTESKMVVMQSGGITLKVKAKSLQCHSPSNQSDKDIIEGDDKPLEDEEIEFRPPTPDPNFEVRPPVSKGRELSGLCCIM